VVTWNASGIFTISDRRLKQNVRLIGEIGELGVYEYAYGRSDRRVVGLMAQEVIKLAPRAVRRDRAGHMSVNYAEALRAAA
jgi:hypothetical protein